MDEITVDISKKQNFFSLKNVSFVDIGVKLSELFGSH